MLVYSHASIYFIIQETGTHHHVGDRGIQCRSATFISLKIRTVWTYVAVCNILRKIKKGFDCAEGEAVSHWMRNLLWRTFKGAILHQLMSKGVNRRMHCLETTRCYTREFIYSKADQGWNDSKLALKNWVLAYKQMRGILRSGSWKIVASSAFSNVCQRGHVISSVCLPIFVWYPRR